MEPVYDAYSSLHIVASWVRRISNHHTDKEALHLLEEPGHDALPDVEAHDLDELFGDLGQERLEAWAIRFSIPANDTDADASRT